MGLISNGSSVAFAQAGRLMGGTSIGTRGRVPYARFGSQIASFPVGMGFQALIPAMKAGGIAGRVFASSLPVASISATGTLNASVSGAALVSASPNRGSQISASASGLATVIVAMSGNGNISAFLRISAIPSATENAGQLLDVETLYPGGPTIRQALLGIRNTTSLIPPLL